MLISLRPKVITTGVVIEKSVEHEPVKEEDLKQKSEEEPSDDLGYRMALFDAILSKDNGKEKEIFDKYLKTESGQDEYNKIRWEVERLFLLQVLNKENKMEEIAIIHEQHLTHSFVNSRLATLYQGYEEFERAASLFHDAAINAKSTIGKFDNLCHAAKCWAKNKNMSDMSSAVK
jgi:hypothetical protein